MPKKNPLTRRRMHAATEAHSLAGRRRRTPRVNGSVKSRRIRLVITLEVGWIANSISRGVRREWAVRCRERAASVRVGVLGGDRSEARGRIDPGRALFVDVTAWTSG